MEEFTKDKLLGIRDVIKTEDARINYLRGLIRIAECDADKSASEEGFIYKIADILGSPYSEISKAESSLEDEAYEKIHFETKQEKILFLMQALYMCWLDNDYSEAERDEIVTIGTELGIEEPELGIIETWIKQGIEWMRTGATLLNLE